MAALIRVFIHDGVIESVLSDADAKSVKLEFFDYDSYAGGYERYDALFRESKDSGMTYHENFTHTNCEDKQWERESVKY